MSLEWKETDTKENIFKIQNHKFYIDFACSGSRKETASLSLSGKTAYDFIISNDDSSTTLKYLQVDKIVKRFVHIFLERI